MTLGALLGTAAHIEGKGSSVLDKAGLAQKYGAVISHVRISESPDQLHAVRIGTGRARLLLGCDMIVAASSNATTRLTPGNSYAIINDNETPTGDFTRNPDIRFPGKTLKTLISNTHRLQFDMSRYSSGIYHVKVSPEDIIYPIIKQ